LHDPISVQDRDQFSETVRFLDRRLIAELVALRSAVSAQREIQFLTADSLDARLAELILTAALAEYPKPPVNSIPFVVAIGLPAPAPHDGIALGELGDHTFTATLATQSWFLGMSLLETNSVDPRTYVVFDIEATSLDLARAEIVELAAVRIDGFGQAIGEPFEQLVQVRHVPRELSKLTGIQGRDLRDAPPIGEVLQSFLSWLRPDDVLVGHNAIEFDLALINRHAAQQGLDAICQPCIDTLPLARRYVPDLSHKLGDLAKSFVVPERPNHRALPDVRTTVDVFLHLRGIRARQMSVRAFDDALPIVAASILLSKLPVGPDNQALLNAGTRRLRSWPENPLARAGSALLGPSWNECERQLLATRDSREEEAWNDFANEWLENIRRHLALRPHMSLAELCSHLALTAGSATSSSDDLVTMMSIHASKGKEWETVVITAVESDQFPSMSSPSEEEIAEGERLLYVGVTRAKDRLALFYCHRRGEHRHFPHPLLEKFPADERIVNRIYKRMREPAGIS
jgi:DNA polymerase III epsilon subunit-like protein